MARQASLVEFGPREDRQGNVRTGAAVEDSQGGANRGGVCPGLAWQDRLGVARSVKVSYGTARQAGNVKAVQGMSRYFKEGRGRRVWVSCGKSGRGRARNGRQGTARSGEERSGEERSGKERQARRVGFWRVPYWKVVAGYKPKEVSI